MVCGLGYSGAGWKDSDISSFEQMLRSAILPLVKNGSSSNGNWEVSMNEALIGIGSSRMIARSSDAGALANSLATLDTPNLSDLAGGRGHWLKCPRPTFSTKNFQIQRPAFAGLWDILAPRTRRSQ
jgi:hypothetical protein